MKWKIQSLTMFFYLVIEHFLKVRYMPITISAVSCKTLRHMIVDPAPEKKAQSNKATLLNESHLSIMSNVCVTISNPLFFLSPV